MRAMRASFVANMVEAEVVHNQDGPIVAAEFVVNMAGDIVVDFGEILLPGRGAVSLPHFISR